LLVYGLLYKRKLHEIFVFAPPSLETVHLPSLIERLPTETNKHLPSHRPFVQTLKEDTSRKKTNRPKKIRKGNYLDQMNARKNLSSSMSSAAASAKHSNYSYR